MPRALSALLLVLCMAVLPGTLQAQGRRPSHVSGEMGVRPFLGATGDLDVHGLRTPPPVAGNKLVLGADLHIGAAGGLGYVAGLHMGAGEGSMFLQPLFEVHYRFDTPIPLVPWVGGGISGKFGFRTGQALNFALTFRFVTGVDYFFTDSVGLGMQLAIPDLGPKLLPTTSMGPVGTIEWLIGPHFRF
ncbi:MAG: hypothetical protein ACOC0J_00405 [Myxococcota bacterium]